MSDERTQPDDEQALLEEATRLTNEAIELWSQSRYPETEALFQRALEIWERTLGRESSEVARGSYNLGNLYQLQERYDLAIDYLERSLAAYDAVLGKGHPDSLHATTRLAEALFGATRYDEAENAYGRAVGIAESGHGAQAPELADALMDLAHALYFVGKYGESEPHYLRALEIREKALGESDPKVADCTQRLGILYRNWEQAPKDPEPFIRRTLCILEKAYQGAHPGVGEALCRLADMLHEKGNDDEAERLYSRMFEVFESLPDHPADDWSWMRSSYEDFLRDTGRRTEADELERRWDAGGGAFGELMRDMLERQEMTLGAESPEVADTLLHLANMHLFEGNQDEAEKLLRRSVQIRESALGPDDPATAESMDRLAVVLRAKGELDNAEGLLARALSIRTEHFGDDSLEYADSLQSLAAQRECQERFGEAEQLHLQALSILEQKLGLQVRDTAESLWRLAHFYMRREMFDKARDALRRLLDAADRGIEDVGNLVTSDYVEDYACVLEALGRAEEANEMHKRAAELLALGDEEMDE